MEITSPVPPAVLRLAPRTQRQTWTCSLDERGMRVRLGKLLLAELLKADHAPTQRQPPTLDQLWQRYSRECADFLDNKEKPRKDAQARARVLLGFFGAELSVEELSVDHQRPYEQTRQTQAYRDHER